MNFTVYCCCFSQRNTPCSPFNKMALSALIAFWEARVVLSLASLLHFPWCNCEVLSLVYFFLFAWAVWGKKGGLRWSYNAVQHEDEHSTVNVVAFTQKQKKNVGQELLLIYYWIISSQVNKYCFRFKRKNIELISNLTVCSYCVEYYNLLLLISL